MAQIALTVGPVATASEYATRLKRIEKLAQRLHIDVADGVIEPAKSIDLAQVYDLPDVPSDLHLMVQQPARCLETVISLGPSLAICHVEAEANWPELFGQWREVGIKVGLALKPNSGLELIQPYIDDLDHVLIFTGDHLGYNHSHFNEAALAKVQRLRQLAPRLEIGVDGGLNPSHARAAVAAGADMIVSGGYVVDADSPAEAYAELMAAIGPI